MTTLRSGIRRTLCGISYHLGGPRLYDVLRGGQIRILMYHGIPTRESFDGIENYQGYNLPAQELERHFAYLKRRCNVVSFEDAVAGRTLSKGKTNIVLTFDDGYENNYTNAYRLLDHYNFPAIFALPTAFVCDGDPLFNDVFEYAVNHSQKKKVCIPWDGEDHEFSIDDFSGKLALFDWLMVQGTSVDQIRRKALTTAAVDALGVSLTRENLSLQEDYRPLTAKQIKKMAASGLAVFASHSTHHCALYTLDAAGQRAELIGSKSQIEQLTATSCNLFCVPSNLYDDESLGAAFAAGYEYVFTSDRGIADFSKSILNRNSVFHAANNHEFVDRAHGPVFEAIGTARRVRRAVRTFVRPAGTI